MSLEFSEILLLLFIGVGPVKSLIPYMDAVRDLDPRGRRGIAIRITVAVAVVAVLLLALGRILEELFHFSEPALTTAAGLIFLILGVRMVFPTGGEHDTEAEPYDTIVPLAIPLTLNPLGIAALIFLSASTPEMSDVATALVALAAVVVLDLIVFIAAASLPTPRHAVIAVFEIVLGVLVVALSVDVLYVGLNELAAGASH